MAPDHQPLMTLENTILESKEGLEAMKFSDADFRQSQLMRLKVLEAHLKSGRLTTDLTCNLN